MQSLTVQDIYFVLETAKNIATYIYTLVSKSAPTMSPITSQHQKQFSVLSDSFLFLNDAEEMFHYLESLFSESELFDIQQRLEIAVRLYYGISYAQIEKELGVSSTTIAKISKEMKKKNNGYSTVIHRMYQDTEE